jgi:hypothetical protein
MLNMYITNKQTNNIWKTFINFLNNEKKTIEKFIYKPNTLLKEHKFWINSCCFSFILLFYSLISEAFVEQLEKETIILNF